MLFERRDRPLRGRDEISACLAGFGRDRLERGRRGFRELGHVPEPLALRAKLVLLAGLQALGVGGERAKLVQPRLGGRGVTRQLVVGSARRRELPPRTPSLACRVRRSRECVEDCELVAGTREPPLFELAAHGEERLDRLGDVLARGSAAPGVGARPPIREDPPGEGQALLAGRLQLGELPERLVFRQVELGFDIRLLARRSDQRRIAARAEQEPDRVREDRLPRAGLTGDRVQTGIELELGLPDQDEVLDPKPPQHPAIVGRALDCGDCLFRPCPGGSKPRRPVLCRAWYLVAPSN